MVWGRTCYTTKVVLTTKALFAPRFAFSSFIPRWLRLHPIYIRLYIHLPERITPHNAVCGRERRACCGYLNQGRGLSPLPPGETTTPNYSLNHARSGSDRLAASNSPLRSRPRRSRPLRSYLQVIFMRFRGPDGPKGQISKSADCHKSVVVERSCLHRSETKSTNGRLSGQRIDRLRTREQQSQNGLK